MRMKVGSETDQTHIYYITTPIYYVNAEPHIGHAYTTIAADVLARFWRMRGRQVLFVTGTDEHGLKVANAAEVNNLSPQEHVDRLAEEFKKLWKALNISYDVFIRTTEQRHRRATQHLFQKLTESGDIYRGEYEGWYCIPCETYLSEGDVVDGRCPNPECGRPVTWLKEPCYFFRTSRYAEPLREYLTSHPEFLLPDSRRNEVLNFLQRGLRDACVSRSRIEWGIEVPGAPENIIYVWFDALINYLTVAGYPDETEAFSLIWPPSIQLMAKDILPRFHATLWPAMLMAAKLPLPQMLFAHGFWTVEKKKISKSLGNVINPLGLAASLAETSGADQNICIDAIRYFLMREVTFGLDGDFSRQALINRFNADLANDLGNLLNRMIPFLEQFSWRVPQATVEESIASGLGEEVDLACTAIGELNFSGALGALWSGLGRLNKYFDQKAPWNLAAPGQREQLSQVIYTVLDGLRAMGTALLPFMPYTAAELLRRIGAPVEGAAWETPARFNLLSAGRKVAPGSPLFPRIQPKKGMIKEIVTQESPTISIQEFQKVDMRVGTVLEAERIAGTDKLLRLVVDTGDRRRTTVAGIGDKYAPETLVNKQVVVVTNLPPVKIRGVVSEGMILAAAETERAVDALVTIDTPLPPGRKVR